jgi:amidase
MNPTTLDAEHLSQALAARDLSSVEVMTACLDRIERVNPTINAIVSLRPREALLAEAKAADAAERSGPLHGMPMAHHSLPTTYRRRTTLSQRASVAPARS